MQSLFGEGFTFSDFLVCILKKNTWGSVNNFALVILVKQFFLGFQDLFDRKRIKEIV